MGRGTLCITHGEDADGLICAAYLVHLREAEIKLVSYDDLGKALSEVRPPLDELFICDLNVRDELRGEILRINGFAKVTIVDHHPTAGPALDEFRQAGMSVVYSTLDCSGALLYDHFRLELPREGARIAAYAAISDQFEEGPIASGLLNMFDRHFVQHEAMILTHALSTEDSPDFKMLVVRSLSQFGLPHRINGASSAALSHLEKIAGLIEVLPRKATRLGRMAYVEAPLDISLGTVSNLLLDSIDVDVGVCFKSLGDGMMNVSVRCRRGLAIHLGEATKRIALRRGGFGGGHSRASGASIPQRSLTGFIEDLRREIESMK